jgi:hypothetical protein
MNTVLRRLWMKRLKKKPIKSLKLEMWGRKWNLVLRDIPGKLDETPRVTEINVMLLTAVHRLAGGIDENKRNCIVCFSNLMDRDEVLQKGIALKPGSGYSVVPDLPPSVSILRSKLLNEKRNVWANINNNKHTAPENALIQHL